MGSWLFLSSWFGTCCWKGMTDLGKRDASSSQGNQSLQVSPSMESLEFLAGKSLGGPLWFKVDGSG